MKIKSALSMGLVLTGLIVGGFTYTNTLKAEASSWHKGSPKIARGTWTDKYKYPKGAMYDVLYISKNLFVFDDNDPHLSNLKYKKVGLNAYKFKGYEFELGKTVTDSGKWYFISKHHVRVSWLGYKFNLYK